MSGLLLAAHLLTLPTLAGETLLYNDSFTGSGAVAVEAGFVVDECWASVYQPAASDYPFSIEHVDMLIGGSTADSTFTVNFWTLPAPRCLQPR